MTTYRGNSYGFDVWVQDSVGGPGFEMKPACRKLRPRLDLFNHSPTGFAWGHGGSGPAQLALAILADVFGDDELAIAYHQDFKFRVIGRLEQNEHWVLTEEQILAEFARLEEARPK